MTIVKNRLGVDSLNLKHKICGLALAGALTSAGALSAGPALAQEQAFHFDPDAACSDVLDGDAAFAAVWALGYFARLSDRPRAISSSMTEDFLKDFANVCRQTPNDSYINVLKRLFAEVVPVLQVPRNADSGDGASVALYEGPAAEIVNAILQPDADLKAVLISLKPADEDVKALFPKPMAAKLIGLYEKLFGSQLTNEDFPPPPYDVNVNFSTTFGLADDPIMLRQISNGFKDVLDKFQLDAPFGTFEILFPEAEDSMRLDGLIRINGHWVLMPRPYRAL